MADNRWVMPADHAIAWMSHMLREMNNLDAESRGGHNGGMESRIARLESAVEYIQRDVHEMKGDIKSLRGEVSSIRTTDFRLLFGAIIAVAVGLAGIMAKGFGWL